METYILSDAEKRFIIHGIQVRNNNSFVVLCNLIYLLDYSNSYPFNAALPSYCMPALCRPV